MALPGWPTVIYFVYGSFIPQHFIKGLNLDLLFCLFCAHYATWVGQDALTVVDIHVQFIFHHARRSDWPISKYVTSEVENA
jgi:hypothetical protein